MSQQGKKIKYPVLALESFYRIAKEYETRLDCLLADHYTKTLEFSEAHKTVILDTYLAARATVNAVESSGLLGISKGKKTVDVDAITARVLSDLLLTLSEYQKKLSSININIDLH